MKSLSIAVAFAAVFVTSTGVRAQPSMAMPIEAASSAATPADSAVTAFTEGEVRRVDTTTQKLTIKHGDIKNLGMSGMTMVFKVTDPTMLTAVKAGDKVRFTADRVDGALTVMSIQKVGE